MVGENFEINSSQMAKIAFKFSMVGANVELIRLKWLKLHLNLPPWLEEILKLTRLKWLKLHLNSPPWLEKF